MKTTQNAVDLLNTIAMLQRKINKSWEANKERLCGPTSNDIKERYHVRILRAELADWKKWREASERMLIVELLKANGMEVAE